jgi:radical SAM protein with 4Fe4S-binding SPASM domain
VTPAKLTGIDLRRPVYLKVDEHQARSLPADYVGHHVRPIRLHEIDFYITMRCNLPCRFCSVRAGEYDHPDLPLDRCLQIIEEASALGLQEMHFLGGEPTLRTDLEEMVEYASQRNIETRIITNGLTLRRDRIRRLQSCGLAEVMISIDGLRDAHTFLRGCGSKGWEASWQCVDNAVAAGMRVRVAATAYRENYDDMLPLMELAAARGADRFSIFLGSPLGRGHGMMGSVLDPHAWRHLQESIAGTAAGLRSTFSVIMEQGFAWQDGPAVDRSQLKGRGTGCNTLLEDFDYLIVRSDGNLYQCVFFMTEGKPIGNVWSAPLERTLQYALDCADYREFTEPHDRCTSCHHSAECGTGCRGYAYLYTNDWLKTDPRCNKTDPLETTAPEYFPLCPILKWNARSGKFGGSSDQALELADP